MKKTIYLECKMGAAGDMLGAALIDLIDDSEEIIRELEHKHKIKVELKDNLYYVFKADDLLFIAHTLSALERNMKIKEQIK